MKFTAKEWAAIAITGIILIIFLSFLIKTEDIIVRQQNFIDYNQEPPANEKI